MLCVPLAADFVAEGAWNESTPLGQTTSRALIGSCRWAESDLGNDVVLMTFFTRVMIVPTCGTPAPGMVLVWRSVAVRLRRARSYGPCPHRRLGLASLHRGGHRGVRAREKLARCRAV